MYKDLTNYVLQHDMHTGPFSSQNLILFVDGNHPRNDSCVYLTRYKAF